MESVEGIILMICCYKHEQLRKKYRLKKDIYNDWKVIHLFGNPNLESEYVLTNNTLVVKSEDTYLHLSNKIIKGMNAVKNIFNIKQGIIKCDDDLAFRENELINFINIENKDDYMGKNFMKQDIIASELKELNQSQPTQFIINYYNKHDIDKKYINEYLNKYNLNINQLNKIPNITRCVALGHIYYVSMKAVNIIITEYNNNNNNIFHLDKESQSYPYICEDIGVGFALFKNNINLKLYNYMWYNPHYQNFDNFSNKYICLHTNDGNC